ncbi:MAG: hypothetical protein KBT29_02840 [Prevotellaceae bacterium]|nr:hypothetical protein [Candidatus Minthosoma caballi]
MKKGLILSILLTIATAISAQEAFTGKFYCEALKATMQLSLADNNIALPDLDFEDTYGYLKGNLNGTWVILKVKKADDKKALVRMISDMGNDAQDVELTFNSEGNIEMKLVGGEQNIKTIEGSKYVKLPKAIVFVKK